MSGLQMSVDHLQKLVEGEQDEVEQKGLLEVQDVLLAVMTQEYSWVKTGIVMGSPGLVDGVQVVDL